MTYPSHRKYRSWVTQRLVNRAPEYTYIRRAPWSVGQQLINSVAPELQETNLQLVDMRYNSFLSTANTNLLDKLYKVDFTNGMTYTYQTLANGEKVYNPPTVYATIGSSEQQITIAERNDIETLVYDCLPSRIEDGETNYSYLPVIPTTSASNLANVSPNNIVINSHLYITISNNSSWEYRALDRIYYPKCYITGTTRKGTTVREAIPLRYNGTFKTVNEWQSVTDVFVSYIDSNALITIETFPWAANGYLDTRNVYVPPTGGERIGFLRVEDVAFGSILHYETFTSAVMDIVRAGIEEKEPFYKVELLNDAGGVISANGFTPVPFTRFIYVVDNENLYVYDTNFPIPDLTEMSTETPDSKIDIYSDNWVYARGDTVNLKTRNRTVGDVPYQTRWKVKNPSGSEYYMKLDGTLLPLTYDAWIANDLWDEANFREHSIDFTVIQRGTYIFTLESQYINEQTDQVSTTTTKFMVYVPSIKPEVTLPLPVTLQNPENISIDSDGNIWIKRYTGVDKLNMFFDYFIADYQNNRIWLRENYSSVRVRV